MSASSLSPQQRSLRARTAAHARWAKEDPTLQGAILRRGFLNRFFDEVDPERILPEAERNRRAESALKAHMYRLALASSRARGARKSA
jgi:hypothetical protein